MRDPPSHPFSMPGGMWGVRLDSELVRRLVAGSWTKILADSLTYAARELNGPDQAHFVIMLTK